MIITGAQIRMARGYLGWSVKQLADLSGVAYSTIKRMEENDGVPSARGPNIAAVYQIFLQEGLEFIAANGGGVGVRLTNSGNPPEKD